MASDTLMISNTQHWWDRRFGTEGMIWGEAPSPTAQIAVKRFPPGARVVEIGFGYGRDLAFMAGQGFRVTGIDLSSEAKRSTEQRLRNRSLEAEALLTGRFEDGGLRANSYDAVLSHRMAHLLISPESIAQFAQEAHRILSPGGVLCLGTRNPQDLENDGDLVCVSDEVYEYVDRPGHRINYCWDDDMLRETFGAFEIRDLVHATEPESQTKPALCHLTILIAQKMK